MQWQKQLVVLSVLTLSSAWPASGLAHDNHMVEEVLKVLRTNGQILNQQYQELLGKAHASESSQASPTTSARPKVGYKPGQGFEFESADGKHTLAIGGRVLTRWGYTDRDGDATGQSDESELRIAAARLLWQGHAFSPKLRYFFQTEKNAHPSPCPLLRLCVKAGAAICHRLIILLSFSCNILCLPSRGDSTTGGR